MDVRFLKEISEGYVIHRDLDITPNEIFENIYDLVEDLRENDLELYEDLYDNHSKMDQQQIFQTYLDFTYMDDVKNIEEVGISISLSTLLITALIAYFRKDISNATFKVLSGIGKGLDSIGSFLSQQGKRWRFRYSIIQRNAKECYQECDISKKNVSSLAYLAVSAKGSLLHPAAEQGKCLKNCYVEFQIDGISLYVKNYFTCLKGFGGFSEIQDSHSPDELMKLIQSTKLGMACSEYFNIAKKAFADFDTLLDFVYEEEDVRDAARRKLRQKMYGSKQEIQQSRDSDGYKSKQGFQKGRDSGQQPRPKWRG